MQKLAGKNIEDILSLTPVQAGMLFHYLQEPGSNRYCEQLRLEIAGAIDLEIFEKAWAIVTQTNEMLRTLFRWENLEIPVQMVLREHKTNIQYREIPAPFDLREVPFRITLCKFEERRYEMIIDNHHILYDGWSNGLLLKEFFEAYGALSTGQEPPKLIKTRFREFIKSVHNYDSRTQDAFWRDYLNGFDCRMELSIKERKKKETGAGSETGHMRFPFPLEITGSLDTFIKKHKITLATLFYTAWGLLLQKYNNCDDVIFGTTVSGRSGGIDGIDVIDGIENMVGLFINTLPVRVQSSGSQSLAYVLYQVRQALQNMEAYNHTPLAVIKQCCALPAEEELFDSLLVMESYPLNCEALTAAGTISAVSYAITENTNYDLAIGILPFKTMAADIGYKKELFAAETIIKLCHRFTAIIKIIIENPGLEVAHLDILSPGEKREILYDFNADFNDDFNDRKPGYPSKKILHQLFEEQVAKTPHHAAVFGEKPLSYRELNEKSGRLAFEIRNRGIKGNAPIGLMVERSPEMITGILGILKAGCAYVPLNPGAPGSRTGYMLQECKVEVLVTRRSLMGEISRAVDYIFLEDEENYREIPVAQAQVKSSPGDFAYVIFTSGSTGMPKAVPITHANLSPLLHWGYDKLGIGESDRVLQNLSYYFDWSVWEIFITLITGACLYTVPDEILLKPGSCISFMEENGITVLHITPTQYGHILQVGRNLPFLKYLFIGAEKLSASLLERSLASVLGGCRVFNMYGPTEATIISAVLEIHRERCEQFASLSSIPIGKAAGNNIHVILDKHQNLSPVNIAGELYIGGDGVSVGYLNNVELTSEKFITRSFWKPRNLFSKRFLAAGGIFYRTGDMARWLPGGDIEFLGRGDGDGQVKIRGYRIELNEIQSRLSGKPGIKDSVLTASEDKNGNKYICAYLVTDSGFELSIPQLREKLSQELPNYMIPTYFIKMAAFPLNPNGKINYRELPEPGELEIETGSCYVPPRSPMEQKLAEIWQNVLSRKKIGITDDFFMLGGDSIKAIQVASRMNKQGLDVELKNIFTNPTISELALLVKKLVPDTHQEVVCGQIPLTPIQKEFFAFSLKNPHHFNMATLLFLHQGLEEQTLSDLFLKIIEHHDALRITYQESAGEESAGEIIQENHGLDYPLHLQIFDYRGRQDAQTALKEQTLGIHNSIDLARGPLLKLALFHLDDGDYLLIVIHHLVVDGISWRILFEDFDTLYRQYREGEPLALPLKTGSFKHWAEKLSAYARSETLLEERAYWYGVAAIPVPQIRRDFSGESNYIKDMTALSFRLSETETQQLLTVVNYAFRTEINDILLTALGLALKGVFGQRRFAVSLEGHGREELFRDFNVNRTIGWFTTIYPVILNLPDANDLAHSLKEIKETLHRVPNKGIGYGILKHLVAGPQKELPDIKPQVSFNYLGEFDTAGEQTRWEFGEDFITNSIGPDEQRRHDFDISGIITNKCLTMTIIYSPGQYRAETVNALWQHYEDRLKGIISFCTARERPELTPCDLTYKHLAIEKVEQLSKQYALEDIYRLSPMQSGMLFSALNEADSAAYFEQMSYRLEGDFEIPVIKKSLAELFKRHPVLRTVFINEGLNEPLQVVLKPVDEEVDIEVDIEAVFYFKDLGPMPSAEEKNSFIKEYKKQDLRRSFNLNKDILCRLAVFRITDKKYEFAWSFHHILLDGWSVGILNSEFFQVYNNMINGRGTGLPPSRPYRVYIEWLQRLDKEAARIYWRKYLEGCNKVTGIPRRLQQKTGQSPYKNEEISLHLEEEITTGLKRLAGKYHITLNTLIQAVWGIILSKYNNTRDVVFGTVVSGRPPQIQGIEAMVGLFLNTIPVRIRFEKDTTFAALLPEIQARAAAGEPYHYISLAEIQAESILKNDLPDHIFVFENYPVEQQLATGAGEITEIESFEQVNYDFHLMIIPGGRLKIILKYNANVFQSRVIERVGDHFKNTCDQVLENETIEIERIKFLDEGEKQKLLNRFNDDLENE